MSKGRWVVLIAALLAVALPTAAGGVSAAGALQGGPAGAGQGATIAGASSVTMTPAGNAFTYQGRLTNGGSPANGPYDFVFSLYADLGGTQWVANAAAVNDLPVTDGLFTALVDLTDAMYGDVYFYLNGEARYLRIGVRPGASTGAYTYLSPLQALTPVPYAQALPGLHTIQNTTSPNVVGGYPWNSVNVYAVGATIGGGGQGSNTNGVTADYGTVAGGQGNTAGQEAAVAGGVDNTAGGSQAAIGGGGGNSAGGLQAVVAGGGGNVAAGQWAAIGGGDVNYANVLGSTVAGGEGNTADGQYATVAGGRSNYAGGNYSLAAGYRAKAYNLGSFVWADATNADFSSTADNQFRVRATGGAEILANGPSYGIWLQNQSAAGDGVRAYGAVSNGNNYAALYAYNSGTSPAIYANTSSGTYAGYFADPISVNGGCVGCLLVYVGINAGDTPLEPGDLVAAAGTAEPLAGTTTPVLRLRRAEAADTPVGVIQGRGTIVSSVKDGQRLESVERAEGPAAPGDYVFIAVQGVAQVKVDAAAGPIAAGTRLAAAGRPGYARALRSQVLNGMAVVEGAPAIGIALEALPAGELTGLISVMVTLR